jgi:hypothetical protein
MTWCLLPSGCRWVLKWHCTRSGDTWLHRYTLVAVDFQFLLPCLWANSNLTVRVIIFKFDDPEICPFRILPAFYCLRKQFPLRSPPCRHISSHFPMNLESRGCFNPCMGNQALEGSIWTPIPFYLLQAPSFQELVVSLAGLGKFRCRLVPYGMFEMGTSVPLASQTQQMFGR